jgi:hypothetical protein
MAAAANDDDVIARFERLRRWELSLKAPKTQSISQQRKNQSVPQGGVNEPIV